MNVGSIVTRARRALRKPPRVLVQRLLRGAQHELDRFTQPRFGRRFRSGGVLARMGANSIDALWQELLEQPFWTFDPAQLLPDEYERVCPGDTARILQAADRAARHEIDLLGSGPVQLGPHIDWHRDYKTGHTWPLGYFRSIDYVNRGRPSDVKTVWELSRLQWLLPCAQAYVLTLDEHYAVVVREILEQWIDANPYACSVNWGVTMEPAMRVFSWTWLFRACGRSEAWSSPAFREKFLCSLYLHGLFTERFIERSDINGNHLTANAAALVVAGSFFRKGLDARRWIDNGLDELELEIVRQVHPDGVDFEASTAYHRLVAELFLGASMAASACGGSTSNAFRERIAGMAYFIAAYLQPQETAPLWGDHDDARTLPLGPQDVREHRYLIGLIALHLQDAALLAFSGGSRAEAAWWFGPTRAASLREVPQELGSRAFPEGGVYVFRGKNNHVFIDCGPLGLAGRGGHGHNDLLSFEAVLDGVPLVTEAGCYVYTADFASRQRDRSTVSHNTPMVDGEEINRFLGPEFLWNMFSDARHEVLEFHSNQVRDRFVGRHDGYMRLASGVSVQRTIELLHATSTLSIRDEFAGKDDHAIEIPLHLHPHVTVEMTSRTEAVLACGNRRFSVRWSDEWTLYVTQSRRAPSYGRRETIQRLAWRRSGPLRPMHVVIAPLSSSGGMSP